MTDDTWSEADDARFLFEVIPDDHPVAIVREFVARLHEDDTTVAELVAFVTPESAETWSDFLTAQAFVLGAIDIGIGSNARRAIGAPDVVFVRLIENTGAPRVVANAEEIPDFAFVTLIWRPEADRWLIHAIGAQIDPDQLPRTSPGVAPEVRR